MRSFTSSRAFSSGTPMSENMAVICIMTSGKHVFDVPFGWWAMTASILSPFSLSLSASMISAGVMSMPHMNLSASCSLAFSAPYEKRVSA